MDNNENEKATYHNPIEKILALCSGASAEILKECPRTEIIKHAGIGGTIVITTILAFISGSYALFTVFKSYPAAILFGLFWALMIFNLDRLIVSSMRKRGSWKQQFKMAIPRILLALVIAVVISKPLEVKLLETNINKTLSSNIFKQNEAIAEKRKKIEDNYSNRISTEQGKITKFQSEKPILLASLQKEIGELEKEEENERKKASKRNSSHNFHLNRIKQQIVFSKAINPTSDFLLKEIERLEEEKDKIGRKIWQNNAPVIEVSKKLIEVQEQISQQFDTYNNQLESLQNQVNGAITGMNQDRKIEFEEFDRLASGVISNFENNSLIDQIEALSIASEKNNLIAQVSWFIMLLFIVVETAPIFVKLISPRGPYDALLDASEYKSKIQAQSIMTMLDVKEYEVKILAKDTINLATHAHNKKFEVLAKINKQDIEQELSNNKAVLETISNAHHVLIKDQVDDWLESERAKLKNNKPSSSPNNSNNIESNGEFNGSYQRDYI